MALLRECNTNMYIYIYERYIKEKKEVLLVMRVVVGGLEIRGHVWLYSLSKG